jgi:hypothetical protein
MKITKILVALSFLFAVTSANAGEMTVTGNMEATYHTLTHSKGNTGNPLGMDKELKFSGSTELDNGITVSVMQDTNDALTFGNSQIAFGNILGLATIYVGSDSDPMDAKDDITPSAYEEANGSGSGSYISSGTTSSDIGRLAGQMGIGLKLDIPYAGALDAKYYPSADAVKNADNSSSGVNTTSNGTGKSMTLVTDLAALSMGTIENLTLTTGYATKDTSNAVNTDDSFEFNAALNYAYGPVKIGLQRTRHEVGNTTAATDSNKYDDTMIGIAYAVNDNLSISWNRYTSLEHGAGDEIEQETDALNLGYTIGGMTIGLQNATTDNSGYVIAANDDTRTLGVSVAF